MIASSPTSGWAATKNPPFRWVQINDPTAILHGRSHQPSGILGRLHAHVKRCQRIIPASREGLRGFNVSTGAHARHSYRFACGPSRQAISIKAPYVSGRRSRKNCHVFRTSRIMSKFISWTKSSSLSRPGKGLDLAAWVDEIALAVEFADVPWSFNANPIDGADVNAIGDGGGGLLQLPEIFR